VFTIAVPFCGYSIPFRRFISGNEAHTDETKIRQEDRESVQRKWTEAQKTQKHTVKQSRHKKHAYTSTQLEATLPKHYYSHSNVPHRIS